MVIKALNSEINDLKDEFNQAEHLIQVKDDVNHLIDVDKNINRVETKTEFLSFTWENIEKLIIILFKPNKAARERVKER
jgi:hypothetical protein